ncbi:hypothetical protein Bca4012_076018 [Brassica carinata]
MTKDNSMTGSPPLQLSSCFAALDIPESSGSLYLCGEDPTCWMGVKIPAWRSVVAREVRLQSPTAKGGSFLDNEDVYGLVLKEYGASSPYGLCGIYPIVGLFSLTFEVLNNSGVWRAAEGYCREEELVQWLLRVEAIERGGGFEAPDEGAVEFVGVWSS